METQRDISFSKSDEVPKSRKNSSTHSSTPLSRLVVSGGDTLNESQQHLTRYASINTMSTISPDSSSSPPPPSTIEKWISEFHIPEWAFQGIIYTLLPILIWLALYVIVTKQNLPGGSVFVLVVLEFGGRIAGFGVSLIKLPPMVGMLGLGILIRNVPYIDVGKDLDPAISAPIRQISLAIILTRAGFGLDLNVLLKLKLLVARLAFFPTFFEATAVGLVVRAILGFPWLWSFLVGFVIAAVSPAVIVPRILALKEQGYGLEKGVPTMILASASMDNIVAIVCFGLLSGFIFSTKSLTMTILQGPLEILIGIGTGLSWGFFIGILFQDDSKKKVDLDIILLKLVTIVGGGVSMVLGFQKLGYTGAGVLSCLIGAVTLAFLWQKRNVVTNDLVKIKVDGPPGDTSGTQGVPSTLETIKWGLTFLWKFFEPLLFGVIGCQIVLSTLDKDVLIYGTCCLLIGVVVRFVTVYLMVSGTSLNVKEKLFVAISWIPKATVQAAIAPMALDLARQAGNKEFEDLGLKVLTFGVLVIILTAPVGELGVILAGPRFLAKGKLNEDGGEYDRSKL